MENLSNERGYTETLKCSKSTKELIMNNCIEEYKKHNKDAKYRNITQNEILTRITKYYLEK